MRQLTRRPQPAPIRDRFRTGPDILTRRPPRLRPITLRRGRRLRPGGLRPIAATLRRLRRGTGLCPGGLTPTCRRLATQELLCRRPAPAVGITPRRPVRSRHVRTGHLGGIRTTGLT
ncbi:hypothetical protein [Amycolatopsis decaplanina]|uniref:hypothetical protein n=1 Tax=Amycolatopsis decaplanina TaxID=208441 RepID=UPI00126984EF|nr:hypothetical protein [Amycolatopsis decaplanina]